MLHQTTHVRAALVDLKANLEAKLRTISAMEACVNGLEGNAQTQAFHLLLSHLSRLWELHGVSADLLLAVDTDLAGVTAVGASSPPASV